MTGRRFHGKIPGRMLAARIHELGPVSSERPGLRIEHVDTPSPGDGEVLIAVHYCGVCHTELDEIEGRTPPARLPMIPGHQAIGTVVADGGGCRSRLTGRTVGVAWIHSACGNCVYCTGGQENLCPDFRACGRDSPGGYAQFLTAPEAFVHELPDVLDPAVSAPLLCAGAVGYRALAMTGLRNGETLGLTGFGASGQLVLPMATHRYPDSPVFVFARSAAERDIAVSLGAAWVGSTHDAPPHRPRAIIDTTPAWGPVLAALDALAPGGRLIVNAIRKEAGDQEALMGLDYGRHLWLEKSVQSVANVTRADVRSLLALASEIPLRPRVRQYALEDAAQALLAMRSGAIRAAGVLQIPQA